MWPAPPPQPLVSELHKTWIQKVFPRKVKIDQSIWIIECWPLSIKNSLFSFPPSFLTFLPAFLSFLLSSLSYILYFLLQPLYLIYNCNKITFFFFYQLHQFTTPLDVSSLFWPKLLFAKFFVLFFTNNGRKSSDTFFNSHESYFFLNWIPYDFNDISLKKKLSALFIYASTVANLPH